MNHKFVSKFTIVMPEEAGIQREENTLDSGSQAALRPLPGMTGITLRIYDSTH